MVGIPLPTALAVSLALHATLLAIDAGSPEILHGQAPGPWIVGSAGSGPAPLTVSLFVLKIVPSRLETRPPPSIGAVDPKAPVISDQAAGAGDERMDDSSAESPSIVEPSMGGIPVPIYLDAATVTRRATILEDIEASPDEIGGRTGSGRIVLAVYIGENGAVDRVEVESSPLGEPFLSVVSRQFLSARFAPAELDGVPVKSRMRVEVFIRPMMK